jgi:hypothetical protein
MKRSAIKLSLLLWGELAALPASMLGGVYGGLAANAEISVERERIAREIARIEDEIARFKRLELAA